MREILFRGKRLADGEWAFGNLDVKPDSRIAIITPDDTLIGKYGRVDPSTVGQFTGLRDLYGTRIFEGDIVTFLAYDAFSRSACAFFGVVVFRDGAFWALTSPTFEFRYALTEILDGEGAEDYDTKVIGNVHDNPERLPEYVPELLEDSD